jgi:large subunit ribosomal protein L3
MFLLGYKKQMTRKFLEDGTDVPVTVLEIPRCVVTQIKTEAKEGYRGVQLSCGKVSHLSEPLKGHYRGLGNFQHSREFSIHSDEDLTKYKLGDEIDFSELPIGTKFTIIGISKGRGYQGVVKRHHFHGHPVSHGHKDQLRMPGSIGAGGVQNVKKGKRMAGHMGDERVTIKNIEVVEVDPNNRHIALKGAVPGARNSLLQLIEAAE